MIIGNKSYESYCIRAKIDDTLHENGSMRDPIIYRSKHQYKHPHTDDKFKVYPLYSFACPIVDSLDGVTHAMRTTEYHDKNELYDWFLEKLGLRKVFIVEYGRLALQYTVLSKRKLRWFIDEGLVDGWSDPRMPTVRGFFRREPRVPRFMVLHSSMIFKATIKSGIDKNINEIQVPVNPLDPSTGKRSFEVASTMLVEIVDAQKCPQKINLIGWMNFSIESIDLESKKVVLVGMPNDTEYKSALKCNYCHPTANVNVNKLIYGELLNKPILGKDDNFKEFINKNSKQETQMIGEKSLDLVKTGDVIQIYKYGLFICDKSKE
ncbi:MAG: hypothetical protein MHPSP_003430 [Paramarteilia canceri]